MTCSEPPSPPAVATPWICHALDNNVLRPQACSNTCWRDQLLANECNNQGPRIQVCPVCWLTLLPLFPICFPPLAQTTHYLHISFSWPFSFYSLTFLSFFPAVLSFPWPLCDCDKLKLAYEVNTNIVHTQGTMSGLACDPAVWNVSMYDVFTGMYLCL